MTEEITLEQSIRHFLPTPRQVLFHALLLALAAYLIGPWLGPLVFGFIDPQTTWGRGQGYQIGTVLNWGTLFLIGELLFYTAWIIRRGRKGYDDYKMREFRKALEGEGEA